MAVFVPPTGFKRVSAVLMPDIMVPIFGGERHSKMTFFHCISRRSAVVCSIENVISGLPSNAEITILSIFRVALPVFQIYAQLKVAALCQEMEVLKTQPNFASRVSKAEFIVQPVSSEVYCSVFPTLEYYPTASICRLITKNLKNV